MGWFCWLFSLVCYQTAVLCFHGTNNSTVVTKTVELPGAALACPSAAVFYASPKGPCLQIAGKQRADVKELSHPILPLGCQERHVLASFRSLVVKVLNHLVSWLQLKSLEGKHLSKQIKIRFRADFLTGNKLTAWNCLPSLGCMWCSF